MSAAILARLRHITDEIQHLVSEVDRLSERVLALEADKDTGQMLDIDTLEPVDVRALAEKVASDGEQLKRDMDASLFQKRGPGRPRKAAQ